MALDKGKLTGPVERRELPEPLEFYADSKEQIEESADGMRPQLEQAFKEAMERAKKGK